MLLRFVWLYAERISPWEQLLAFLLGLALLVSNATAGLASRLAGSLALATAATLSGLTKIFGIKSFDCHDKFLRNYISVFILPRNA